MTFNRELVVLLAKPSMFGKQNNQLPIKSHDKLQDTSIFFHILDPPSDLNPSVYSIGSNFHSWHIELFDGGVSLVSKYTINIPFRVGLHWGFVSKKLMVQNTSWWALLSNSRLDPEFEDWILKIKR